MTSREKVYQVACRRNTGPNPFWTGHPSAGALEQYLPLISGETAEDLFLYLEDDCRWICSDIAYKHPEGRPMFDTTLGAERPSLSAPGCFGEATLEDIAAFPWPDPGDLDFTEVLAAIDAQAGRAVFSGTWGMFFHVMCGFFGMEEYFIKMYTEPEVLFAATERIVDFYVEANDRFLKAAGDRFDIVFMGNDFGSQLDLLVSPEAFRRFILPGFKRLIAVAKRHGKKVMLHSCGSIYRVIPDLIDAGVDILHPLQAMAAQMDAATLAREFGRDLAFCGGVDTQHKLIHCTPAQIREEVLRLRDTFGPNYIVSPSHEEILPNIPFENVLAMARAARE